MKKNLVFIALLTTVSLISGCNSSKEIEDTLANKYIEAPQEESSIAEYTTEDTYTTDITYETESFDEYESEETTSESFDYTYKTVEDTIEAPASIGEAVRCNMSAHTYGSADIELTLLDVKRGDAAWDFISQESEFNDPPPKNKEYLLAKFHCKNIKNLSESSDTITINWAQFQLSNESLKPREQVTFVLLDNNLDAKLKEGDECDGYLVYTVDIGQTYYTVHDTGAWFSLQ